MPGGSKTLPLGIEGDKRMNGSEYLFGLYYAMRAYVYVYIYKVWVFQNILFKDMKISFSRI